MQFVQEIYDNAPLKTLENIWNDHLMWGGELEGQYDYFDMLLLWGMITRFELCNIVECSPHKGWSTLIMQIALNDMDGSVSHKSFDIMDYEKKIRNSIQRHAKCT
ncbi:MAG: hypothetical protein ACYC1B_05500, partial [Thermoleophilia bacterium]